MLLSQIVIYPNHIRVHILYTYIVHIRRTIFLYNEKPKVKISSKPLAGIN